jgi:prepilin-type N-terminal cleavage/methylation domain-containing protein
MKRHPSVRPGTKSNGYTLVEILIAMSLTTLVMSMALGVFTTSLRAMYRDMQRLATDASLRSFTSQVAKKTLDATEFYVFSDYRMLDGSVDLTADVSALNPDDGVFQAFGDCLVLVTRVSTAGSANVRQFRIYYRATTGTTHNIDAQAPIRYYESADYGAAGTATSLTALLNAVNLNANANPTGSHQMVQNSRGRLRTPAPTTGPLCYPIFSTESASPTPTNESVSINVEIINGTTVNNLLSSSSFHYTISPRR